MGIDKWLQGIKNLGLDKTITSKDASHQNQNLLINLIPNCFKSPSGSLELLNSFLESNPEILSVVKSFLDFGPHKMLDPKP